MKTFIKSILIVLSLFVTALSLNANGDTDNEPVRQGRPDDLPAREKAIPNILKNDTPAAEKAVPVILNIPWKDYEPASPRGHNPPAWGHKKQKGKGHEIGRGKGHDKHHDDDDSDS